MIEWNTIFVAITKYCKDSCYLPNASKELMICTLPQGPNIKLSLLVSINFIELPAILLRFSLNAEDSVGLRAIIYTDSTITFSGPWSRRLQDLFNQKLRKFMLIAAINNILIEPRWLDSKANGLANVFSQFNKNDIANIYHY